jgi:hypothetical protein
LLLSQAYVIARATTLLAAESEADAIVLLQCLTVSREKAKSFVKISREADESKLANAIQSYFDFRKTFP